MMVSGIDRVQANLDKWYQGELRKIALAMGEICALLENYAKTHHGNTPRSEATVYPGAGVKRTRPGGEGWGDVTGNLTNSIHSYIAEVTPLVIEGVLTANMNYAVFVELARDGKWSWLWPAVEECKDDIEAILKRIMI
jgi:hypothetical protein